MHPRTSPGFLHSRNHLDVRETVLLASAPSLQRSSIVLASFSLVLPHPTATHLPSEWHLHLFAIVVSTFLLAYNWSLYFSHSLVSGWIVMVRPTARDRPHNVTLFSSRCEEKNKNTGGKVSLLVGCTITIHPLTWVV